MPKIQVTMTEAQISTLKEVLSTWTEDEFVVLTHAFNNELPRRQFVDRYTRMLNVALILDQAFGDKNVVNAVTFSPEKLSSTLNNLK